MNLSLTRIVCRQFGRFGNDQVPNFQMFASEINVSLPIFVKENQTNVIRIGFVAIRVATYMNIAAFVAINAK